MAKRDDKQESVDEKQKRGSGSGPVSKRPTPTPHPKGKHPKTDDDCAEDGYPTAADAGDDGVTDPPPTDPGPPLQG